MKKLITGIIVMVVLLFTIFPGIFVKAKERPVVSVGYGWSTEENERVAMRKAVSMVKKQLAGVVPEYILLFSTVGYDSQKVLQEVRRNFGRKVQIHGGTSCLGVVSRDGFHVGETCSLAIMAVASAKLTFGVGGADLEKSPSARDAGKKAILEAIENAHRTRNEQPKLVLMTAVPGKEEEMLLGIEDVLGRGIPVIGGSSADNDISGKWKQFANDSVFINGIALTVIYTNLKVGWAYESGYLRTERQGVVTKGKGRVIYEIDSQPAAEVYNDWIGGQLSDILETGGKVLTRTTFYPLAKIFYGEGGEIYYLSIHPLSFELPEKSLTVFANVKKGDEVSLMRGGWELLLNRARTTSLQATVRGRILPRDIAFGIFVFCAGTMLAIPSEERPKIPLLVNDALVGAPFIGTFTFGEQGFLPGVGNVHGNLVSAMVVFSNK